MIGKIERPYGMGGPLGLQHVMLVWMIFWRRWAELNKSGGREADHTLCPQGALGISLCLFGCSCPLGICKWSSLRLSSHQSAGCCIPAAMSAAGSESGAREYMRAFLP
jgi:hypothetical protein